MKKYDYLISDVDGVLTDGGHYYNNLGKQFKKFGSNDKDALRVLNESFFKKIIFVSSDKRGFEITKKRIQDELGYELIFLPDDKRKDYLNSLKGMKVYIGDGIFDSICFSKVNLSVSLLDSTPQAKEKSNIILETVAGKNVFPHLLKKLDSFDKINKKNVEKNQILDTNGINDSISDLRDLKSSMDNLLFSDLEIAKFCSDVASSYTGKNKVVFCGVGKNATLSEMICEFLHPYNVVSVTLDPHRAVHGNLGILKNDDILIISTKSGNTQELIYLLNCLERKMDFKNKFLIVSNSNSKLEREFGFKSILKIPSEKEIARYSHSPQTTIFIYTAIMMVLVNRISEKNNLSEMDYLLNHQAGEIGKSLKNG